MTKVTGNINCINQRIIYTILTFCFILTTCGCSNQGLIEIKNPDYTYTYKTPYGKVVFNNIDESLSFVNGISVIKQEWKYGLVNSSGKYVVPPIYDYIEKYHDGMYGFLIQDITERVKVGYFNDKGRIAIEPIPADIVLNSSRSYDFNFYNGVAMYRQPNTYKYGFIDKKGNFIINPIYEWAAPFKSKLAPVSKGDKYGYINTSGKLIIPYKYIYADAFSDGLAAVYNGMNWGYIDETGNYAIQPQFGSFEGHDGEPIANPFIDGYAAVYLSNGQTYYSEIHKGKFALIDKNGKILNGLKYDYLNLMPSEHGGYVYEAVLKGKQITIDTRGNIIKEGI